MGLIDGSERGTEEENYLLFLWSLQSDDTLNIRVAYGPAVHGRM